MDPRKAACPNPDCTNKRDRARSATTARKTVPFWYEAAGLHCQALHEHLIASTPMDLRHVQADELRIKAQGHLVWMALCVTTRLWLGGVVSTTRSKAMARALALKVRACALCRPIVVVFDGFSIYIDAFIRWPAVVLGRVIKSRRGRRLERLERDVLPRAQVIIAPGEVDLEAEDLAERLLRRAEAAGCSIQPTLNASTGRCAAGSLRWRVARGRWPACPRRFRQGSLAFRYLT